MLHRFGIPLRHMPGKGEKRAEKAERLICPSPERRGIKRKKAVQKHGLFVSMVGRARFERATLCLKGRYSTD